MFFHFATLNLKMNSFNDQNMSTLPSTDKKDSFPVDIEVDFATDLFLTMTVDKNLCNMFCE